MVGRRTPIIISVACAALGAWLFGCSEHTFIGERSENRAPEVWLSSGPVEGDTTAYTVHFFWGGWDPDGELSHFEFAVVDGDPLGFDEADTAGLDKWTRTDVYDSVFRVTADGSARPYGTNYTLFDKTHTFFIRAVDNEGMRSETAFRSFTAWTLAPFVEIHTPPRAGKTQTFSKVITFEWTGRDPIDDPTNTQDPESIRYLFLPCVDSLGRYLDHTKGLNERPESYERHWSRWIYYRNENDSGRTTTLGDDEILRLATTVFAVQAKDEAGALTSIFKRDLNVREFVPSPDKAPLLTVREPFLGAFLFMGTNFRPETRRLPPGVPLNFSWRADASDYGGKIRSYRYGWDIRDLSDPSQWDVEPSPYRKTAEQKTLYSGIHTLFVEVVDNGNATTIGQILIDIVSFTMERNLLIVDDFYSIDEEIKDYSQPSEGMHDEFWLGICSRADGFDDVRDIYDATSYNFRPPDIEYVGRYKNIIWVYSKESTAWESIVLFTPETQAQPGTQITLNYLSIFLQKGGHLWTSGRSDRNGGLTAVLFPNARSFPLNLRCEITGNQEGCEGDTSGVYSMPYKDYCITVLDKVVAIFRSSADMPTRSVQRDALRYAYRHEYTDSAKAPPAHTSLPVRLDLWEEVTKPGRFFDPAVRGFLYVELYNTKYWVDAKGINERACYRPMFRMKTVNSRSPVNDAAIALWITKYSNVVPEVKGGIAKAAPSFHLGFPLWFFNRAAVDSMVSVFFEEWGILSDPSKD